MEASIDTSVRVRYAETDQMGVVYHSNYLIWMEVGRVEYCRAKGFSYREMEADGVLLVVAEANCRYLSPALYDDEVLIQTSIAEVNPRIVQFEYKMSTSGRLLSTGSTKHVFCTKDRKPTKMPPKYRPLFGLA